jgi:hypothetical protein
MRILSTRFPACSAQVVAALLMLCTTFRMEAAIAPATQPTTAPALSPIDQAVAQRMEELATPGEHHEHLKAMAGTFDAKVTLSLASGGQERTTGRVINEMILGGRYLRSTSEGSFLGKPLHSITLTGYDNRHKKYVTISVDNGSTALDPYEGHCDGAGKIFIFNRRDAESQLEFRQVITIINRNTYEVQLFGTGPGEQEEKIAEMRFTRAQR